MIKKNTISLVGACFGIQAIGVGVYVSYGVFFNSLMTDFGWSRALISGASSVAFFISGLFAILVGRLMDKMGPHLIIFAASVFLGGGCMLLYGLNAVWQLYLFFGLAFGIGLSSVDVVALTTIAKWFPQKRGMITGIVKVGTGAGQFVFPLLAGSLIAGLGWRNAYFIIGAITFVLLAAISQVFKDKNHPEQENISVSAEHVPVDISFSRALKTPALWMLCFVNFTIVFCLMGVMIHIVPHGRDLGVSAVKAAGILSAIGGISMAGRFITGMIIDQIGSRRSMIMALIVLLTGLLWLQFAGTLWELYLFAVVYGFAHGSFFTIISPVVAELFGTRSHGSLFGMIVFFGTVGGSIGPILAGYLFDMTDSYTLFFRIVLSLAAIGLFCSFFISKK